MVYHARWVDRATGKAESNTLYYDGTLSMKRAMMGLWAMARPIEGHPLGFRFEIRP